MDAAPETPTPAPPPPRRRRFRPLRFFLKLVMWLLITVVALLLIAFALLQTEPVRELVRDLALDALNGEIQGRVEVDRIAGMLPFEVELHGVRIFGPDGERTLSVDQVSADFHALALFSNTVHLSEIHLVKPEVLLLDATGEVALARAFAPRVASPPNPLAPVWIVQLESIRLERGVIDRLTDSPRLHFDDTSVDLSLHIGERSVLWKNLVVSTRPSAPLPPLVVVRSDGEIVGDELIVTRCEIDAPPHRVVLSGRIDLADLAHAEVTLTTIEIDLDALPDAIGPLPIHGSVELAGDGTLSDGHLEAALWAATPLAMIEVQLGVEIDREPIAWAGTVRFTGLRPGLLDPLLPQDFEADGSLSVAGAGDPASPAQLHVEGDLLERAPVAGGRLGFALDRLPSGFNPSGGSGMYGFSLFADAFDLDAWFAAFGEPGLSARLARLGASGQVNLVRGAPLQIIAGADFDLSLSGRLGGFPDPVRAELAFGSADLQWGGEGLPVGELTLTLSDASLGDKGAAFANISASLGRDDAGRATLEGVVTAQEVVVGEDVAIAQATVPFDLVAQDFEGIPEGPISVDASGIRAGGERVGHLTGRFDLRRAEAGMRIDGRFAAARVTTSAGADARTVAAKADLWLGWRGQLDGDVDVALTGATLGGARAGRLHVTARVAARRGVGHGLRLAGAFDGARFAAAKMSVAAAEGTFDVTLPARGEPTGAVQARARDAVVAGCVQGRACVLDSVKLDVQLQPNARLAWDVRAGVGALELSLLGVAVLPLGRRALQVDLDRFVVTHVAVDEDTGKPERNVVIVAEQVRYASGLIRVGQLRAVAPEGGVGWIRAAGTVDMKGGVVDLTIDSEKVALGDWLVQYPALVGLVLGPGVAGDDADPFDLGLPFVAGTAEVGGYVRGTLAAPEARLVVTLVDGQLADLTGLRLGAAADWRDGRLQLDAGGSWHEGGRFTARGHLPLTLSLAGRTPGVTLDERGDFKLDVEASDQDLAATQRFLSGVGASGRLEGIVMEGQASLSLVSSGTFQKPLVDFKAAATPLSLGKFEGRTEIALVSGGGATRFELLLEGPEREKSLPKRGAAAVAWPDRKALADIAVVLPFDVAEAVFDPDSLAFVQQRLRDATAETLTVDMQVGRMTLGETPAEAFLGDAARAIEVVAQLHLSGPLADLTLSTSRLEVANVGYAQGQVVLDLASDDNVVSALITATARGKRLVRGSLVVPDAGLMLAEPERMAELLADPRFKLAFFSDDMTTGELWDFSQGLGEIAARFLPDARAMVHINAHGAKAGPEANVIVRLRNGRRSSRRGDSLDRNLADDIRLVVSMRPDATSAVLRVTQDGEDTATGVVASERPADLIAARPDNGDGGGDGGEDAAAGCRIGELGDAPYALTATAHAGIGTTALLAGELPDLGGLPLDARIASCGLQLGRVMRALGGAFGPSRGRLDGRVELSGTVGAPRMKGRLVADFKQLDVSTIGFYRDQLAVVLTFAGQTVTLEPLRLEGKADGGGADESYLSLTMRAAFDRLSARGIRLDGALTMRDFPLVDTRDAKVRAGADVSFGGTVARPVIDGKITVLSGLYQREIGAREVRPLGLPEDVTIVTGAPEPPDEGPEVASSRTGVQLNVSIEVLKDKVIIENDMLRILPWTRDLRIQTIGGEIVVIGTIFVPKEKITLYGKVFRIAADSRVVFTGDMSTDPQLLVSATYDISEVDLTPIGLLTTPESRATIIVRGNAAAPRLSLTSDPPMDESNIINVIIFDAPVGQGDTQDANVRSQVANLVIGVATGSLSRFVTDQLPIDTFQLDTKTGDLTDSRLTVGKRLAKNLFFRYRRNIGADGETESANEFSAEYRVGPVTFLGNYGDIGEFSLETNLHISD